MSHRSLSGSFAFMLSVCDIEGTVVRHFYLKGIEKYCGIFLLRKNNVIIVGVVLLAGCFCRFKPRYFDDEALANAMQKMVTENKKSNFAWENTPIGQKNPRTAGSLLESVILCIFSETLLLCNFK